MLCVFLRTALTLPRTSSLNSPLITSPFSQTWFALFFQMVSVVTSFYQRAANHVFLFLRNLFTSLKRTRQTNNWQWETSDRPVYGRQATKSRGWQTVPTRRIACAGIPGLRPSVHARLCRDVFLAACTPPGSPVTVALAGFFCYTEIRGDRYGVS